jgi:hypothetical protein
MRINEKTDGLDIMIPVALELDWPTEEEVIAAIREQHSKYGFRKFLLAVPSGGWRSVGYPPKEAFVRYAEMFRRIRDALVGDGIECGWWNTATLKSGHSDEFTPLAGADGKPSGFANCPADPAFRKRFAEDAALFAEIACPSLMVLEDDYSVTAGSSLYGCFCKYHLEAFAQRMGRFYSREELVATFEEKTPESFVLLRKWRALTRDSMVEISRALRKAVDVKTPEMPIGYMQAGTADLDGDATGAICRALAGPRHAPFSRFHGTAYCGGDSKDIPKLLYSALYAKQHMEDVLAYHESDTFPHTRFFMPAVFMRGLMSVVYASGFDGSTFQTQQLLDDPNEETAYGRMFRQERARFNGIHKAAKLCRGRGVEITYDPFWNTVERCGSWSPRWARPVGLFGIPYVTTREQVAFWDVRQARYYDHETVMDYLSKGLILDGEAAKALAERGYGKYLGVDVGDEVIKAPLSYDLAAREVLCDGVLPELQGRHMPSPHMYAIGNNGKFLRLTPTAEGCEVLTELVSFEKRSIAPGMTRFVNALGGRVVVMGMTLYDPDTKKVNLSQSLYNYRRQKLLQMLVEWCGGAYAMVVGDANVYVVMNEAKEPEKAGFRAMLTLVNLGEDTLERVRIKLPEALRDVETVYCIDKDGQWAEQVFAAEEDGFTLNREFPFTEPLCLLLK